MAPLCAARGAMGARRPVSPLRIIQTRKMRKQPEQKAARRTRLRARRRRPMVGAGWGMKRIIDLVWTTFLAGVWFLLPIVALMILLNKAFAATLKVVKPIAKQLPEVFHVGLPLASTLTVLLLVGVCFLAGMLGRTSLARAFVRALESAVLTKIPLYDYFKQVGAGVLGMDDLHKHPVVLVKGDTAWQIGVLIGGPTNGFVKVFVPDAPSPLSGSVLIVAADRVKPSDVPLKTAFDGLKRFGVGLDMVDPSPFA